MRSGRLGDRRAWAGLAGAGGVTVALTLPFLFPYLEVQRLYAFERPFGEVLTFSANVWSYATAAEQGIETYLAVTILYFLCAFIVNRGLAWVEKRTRVPGYIAAAK